MTHDAVDICIVQHNFNYIVTSDLNESMFLTPNMLGAGQV